MQKTIKALVTLLEGRKTYGIAVIIAVVNLLVAFNVLTVDHLNAINTFLGSLGLAALRSGVAKVE